LALKNPVYAGTKSQVRRVFITITWEYII